VICWVAVFIARSGRSTRPAISQPVTMAKPAMIARAMPDSTSNW